MHGGKRVGAGCHEERMLAEALRRTLAVVLEIRSKNQVKVKKFTAIP